MNKIIVLPGMADGVFFINEIDYIKKYFDDVVVISYQCDKKRTSEIAEEKGFRCYMVKGNFLKALVSIDFYKWLFSRSTIKEFKNVFSLSKYVLHKMAYIIYYGLFYINAKMYIDKEINKDPKQEIYLYSFWLTRGAYTIANYNSERRKNIKKIISRAHGYDLYEERNKFGFLPFRNFIIYNLDEIHFISEQGLDYFKNKYRIDGNSAKINISRLGTLNPDSVKKRMYDKKIITIVSCSSIIPVKRLDLIIDVIANIEYPIEWIHIGSGKIEENIRSYASKKLKSKQYKFLGQITNKLILGIYEKHDVDYFINMSDSEGLPVSIMEAMSIGIPVIARDVGGIKEIVDKNTGLLIEDISNMKLVHRLINDEVQGRLYSIGQYEKKHKECIHTWIEKYNANDNYNKFFSDLSIGVD